MNKRLVTFITILVFFTNLVYAQSFTNPILAGYYPDPSICKTDKGYFLVNSSFAHYPGLPISHSTDLLNWKLIGHAMNRAEQLPLQGQGMSRGLFAPAISYHNGTYYIVCTEVGKMGNFVITAKDPAGPWSNPVVLPQVNGIDPSLFFDDNGKTFIVFNSIPPNNKSLWNGHRTIRMYEMDMTSLKTTGEERILVNGGTDTAKHPVWIEGPHLYKKNGWYYLMCAEGGTADQHSEVVFRSKSVEGPFIPYDKNPILTQRNLNPSRPDPVTSTGHADLVEDDKGNWWGVFLGCRPYEGDFYNTGRETFMAPVKWVNDWPVFDLGGDVVKYSYPINAVKNKKAEQFSGNYTFNDAFSSSMLNLRYSFLRTVTENWYSLSKGKLTISLRGETASGRNNPSFIGFRQPHLKGYAATALQFSPAAENEKAGLAIFQNETHYYYLCQSVANGKPVVQLYRNDSLLLSQEIMPAKNQTVYFKIESANDKYHFYYAVKKDQWKILQKDVDGKFLSTKIAGGFVGSLYGMYATSNGKPSATVAAYDWFMVKSEDDVYKK